MLDQDMADQPPSLPATKKRVPEPEVPAASGQLAGSSIKTDFGPDEMRREEPLDQAQLKSALDESSRYNNAFLGFFLLFLVYVLVTAASSDDRNLLVPDSQVKLPLLAIELPVLGFFIFTPIMIAIFHLNLLLNLVQHNKIIARWNSQHGNNTLTYLPPFLVNFLAEVQQGTLMHYLVGTAVWIAGYFFPIFLLVLIQIRFSAYHNWPITSVHFLVVMLDMFAIVLYWHRITTSQADGVLDDRFSAAMKFQVQSGVFWPLGLVLNLLRRIVTRNPKDRDVSDEGAAHKRPKRGWMHRGIEVGFRSLAFWIVIAISSLNLMVASWLQTAPYRDLKFSQLLIPRLDIEGQFLDRLAVSREPNERNLTLGETEAGPAPGSVPRLDLRARDLRFANFSLSRLLNADLREARLDGARLWYTDFRGALFQNASVQGAYLGLADLRGAKIPLANFSGTDFDFANLRGVVLQGTALLGAQLSKDPETTDSLQASDLSFADLRGAKLVGALLDGANLDHALLQGADLTSAHLDGVTLREAELQGADLIGARMYGADITGAKLNCVDLPAVDLKGVIFESVDLTTKADWNKELESAQKRLPRIVRADKGPLPGHIFAGSGLVGRVGEAFSSGSHILARLQEARARCEKRVGWRVYPIRADATGFLKVREKLACQASDIANSMLAQFLLDEDKFSEARETDAFRRALIAYMRSHCPSILEQAQAATK